MSVRTGRRSPERASIVAAGWTAGLARLAAISGAPLSHHVRIISGVISTWHCMPRWRPPAT